MKLHHSRMSVGLNYSHVCFLCHLTSAVNLGLLSLWQAACISMDLNGNEKKKRKTINRDTETIQNVENGMDNDGETTIIILLKILLREEKSCIRMLFGVGGILAGYYAWWKRRRGDSAKRWSGWGCIYTDWCAYKWNHD